MQRIARAQRLLVSEPSFSLSRVAVESGFFDHAHLTRSFRRALGVPPSEFRSVLERARLSESTEAANLSLTHAHSASE